MKAICVRMPSLPENCESCSLQCKYKADDETKRTIFCPLSELDIDSLAEDAINKALGDLLAAYRKTKETADA